MQGPGPQYKPQPPSTAVGVISTDLQNVGCELLCSSGRERKRAGLNLTDCIATYPKSTLPLEQCTTGGTREIEVHGEQKVAWKQCAVSCLSTFQYARSVIT